MLIGPPIQSYRYRSARTLLATFGVIEGLRTLDAVQLAIALDLRQMGIIAVTAAADIRLCRVASLAGCPVMNPEKPDPFLASS